MIQKLQIYKERQTNPYRNLALEHHLMFRAGEGECILYLWQNRRTVVIGRNQNAWKECNTGLLEAEGGFLTRRLSGGGAVYHDLGNLNFTFCVRKPDYDVNRQLQVIVRALDLLGIHAQMTGRNDLTVDGKKFSGNAFYQSGNFCIHHGTIMIDVNRIEMERYLQVSAAKLKSKGVASVRLRVMNLIECCPGTAPGTMVKMLEDALEQAFSDVYGLPPAPETGDKTGDLLLITAEEERKITKDAAFFASREWILGKKPEYTHRLQNRFDWGEAEFLFLVKEERIEKCVCYSDAMDPEFMESLNRILSRCCFEKEAVCDAILSAAGDTSVRNGEYEDAAGSITRREMAEDLIRLVRKEMGNGSV